MTHDLLYCLSSEANVSYWMGSLKEMCPLKIPVCVPPFLIPVLMREGTPPPRCEQQRLMKTFWVRIGIESFLTLLYLHLRL